MGDQRLISFDLQADFGFLKKPDYNDGLLLTYNMLHKPALLGLLGAVIGLEGYRKKGELPEYYRQLSALPVGIEPLAARHDKGNFRKSVVKYTNTVGYANQDGNLLIEESMLIKPGYRCYLLLSMDKAEHQRLYEYLQKGWAEYIPYLGKNEYPVWFGDTLQEYRFTAFEAVNDFTISSLFIKEGTIQGRKITAGFNMSSLGVINQSSYAYFERLPVGFDTVLMQYELADFAFTDWVLKAGTQIGNLYSVVNDSSDKVIQLF